MSSTSKIEWTRGDDGTPGATDLAYLAGIVDADGYVTATMSTHAGRVYFGAQVGITGSAREPHDLAAKLFGGRVSAHSPGNGREHHRTQYHWQRCGARAVPIIEALRPFLRIKENRAALVVHLQEEVDYIRATRGDDDPFPWMPAGWDPTPGLISLVDEIRTLSTRYRTWDQYLEVAR
jgi:hypothetical protein